MSADTWYARYGLIASPQDLGGEIQFRAWCEVARLSPEVGAYAMVLSDNDAGERRTHFTPDIEYVRLFIAGAEALGGLEGQLPAEKFHFHTRGWPVDWLDEYRAHLQSSDEPWRASLDRILAILFGRQSSAEH